MLDTTALPPGPVPAGTVAPMGVRRSAIRPTAPSLAKGPDSKKLRVVPWVDPVADPHGLHPCSRYVELYWLPVIGPSTTWLLRRLSYGLDVHGQGFDLDLAETARSLGLGERMGKNSPFRKAIVRLGTFGLARGHGPDGLSVRTVVPPLPLRHLSRLPEPLQVGHRRWTAEQRLPEPEQMRRRAHRLAVGLANAGRTVEEVERQLGAWHFHPAVAFDAARSAGTAGARPTSPS